MIQRISVPTSVNLTFDHKNRKVFPKEITWEGKTYLIRRVGLHHMYREGRTLYHVFSVESSTLFFKLKLNTDNLQWTLEEISDGEAN